MCWCSGRWRRHRISLRPQAGHKEQPWDSFAAIVRCSVVEAEVKSDQVRFIGLEGDNGMVHFYVSHGASLAGRAQPTPCKDEVVKAIRARYRHRKGERISLGMKQRKALRALVLLLAAVRAAFQRTRRSPSPAYSKCATAKLEGSGRRWRDQLPSSAATLSRDRDDSAGDISQVKKFDAMVIGYRSQQKPSFSIQSRRCRSPKNQAVAQCGSSDNGASLGDILGETLKAAKPDSQQTKQRSRLDNFGAGFLYDNNVTVFNILMHSRRLIWISLFINGRLSFLRCCPKSCLAACGPAEMREANDPRSELV